MFHICNETYDTQWRSTGSYLGSKELPAQMSLNLFFTPPVIQLQMVFLLVLGDMRC